MRESRSERKTSPDVAGAVTVTAGLALLVYAVSKAPDHGWGSGWTIVRLVVSAVLLVAFLVIEARAKDPLMPFSIFRVRTVAGANVDGVLLGAVTFANFFVLTLYVQQVLHYSALKTGHHLRRHGGQRGAVGRARAVARDEVGAEAGDDRRLRGVRVGMLPVHADLGATARSRATCCPGTSSSASRCRSRSSRSRSPHSPASRRTRPASPPGSINTAQQVGGAIGVAVASSVSISHFNHLTAQGVPFAAGVHERRAVGVLGHVGVAIAAAVGDRDPDQARRARPSPEVVPAEA